MTARQVVAPSTLTSQQIREGLELIMSHGDVNHRLVESPDDYDILDAMEHGVDGLRASEGYADCFAVHGR